MDDQDYEQMREEAEYLEYEATYRRMYERGYAAGHAVGRAEQMCRIYQQEPLGPRVSKEDLAAIDCPF